MTCLTFNHVTGCVVAQGSQRRDKATQGSHPWRRAGSEICPCRVCLLSRVSLFMLLLFFFLTAFYFGSHCLGEVLDAENKVLDVIILAVISE